MKVVASTTVGILWLALPATVLGLATETFGNGAAVRQPDWAEGILQVVNLKSRVYSRWINGNESFYYRGNAAALAEALRAFAAAKDDVHQLILMPGTGMTQSFGRGKVEFDWQLHVPSGIYKAVSKRTNAVMTVYVKSLKPRPLERKQVEQWLADLGSESFKTRKRATQQLQQLGNDAKPFLRTALKAQPTVEARRRIQGLLNRLSGLDVTDLEIPEGLTVVTVPGLVALRLKDLKSTDAHVSAMAIQDLSRLIAYSDQVVPALVGMLAKDKNEYVRRVAAACLGSAGTAAKAAVPLLKQGLNDPDANIRTAFRTALDQINSAKDSPEQEKRLQHDRAILKEISQFEKTIRKNER